jgi:hypothetical protein
MPDVVLVERGVSITVQGVDEPGCVVADAFGTQQAHIEDALTRVPQQHLADVPPIVIGDWPASGGGYRNPRAPVRGHAPAGPCIGLNRATFGADHNRRYLFTLLHEIGHAVDHRLHAVSRFQRTSNETGAEWDAFRAIHYGGRNRRPDGTPAYGEHFAEGYAHMLTRRSAMEAPQQALIRRMAAL